MHNNTKSKHEIKAKQHSIFLRYPTDPRKILHNSQHKLASFSLPELLVGMLLSSIAISGAYFGLEVAGKQFERHRIAQASVLDAAILGTQLEIDIFKGTAIRCTSDVGIVIEGLHEVTYRTDSLSITRISKGVSTVFMLKNSGFLCSWQGSDILSDMGYATDISISVFATGKQDLCFWKIPDSKTIMKIYDNGKYRYSTD